jgi:hypothetical protein
VSFILPAFRRTAARLFVLAIVSGVWSAGANTIAWTNLNGGNWSLAPNWNPNQVPTNTDAALITNAGTYAIQVDVDPNVQGLTLGGSSGIQTLLFASAATLTATNATILTNGVISSPGSPLTLDGAFSLLNGAVANLNGGRLLASGSLTIGSGGQLNATGVGYLQGPVTNQGTISLSNSIWIVANDGISGSLQGGIFNTGEIDLYGNSGDTIQPFGGDVYLLNQGTINQQPGTGDSTIDTPRFVNSGTVNQQSGNLSVIFSGDLIGTYSAAPGTTVSFFGGFITNGTPLALTGGGTYSLAGGALMLLDTTVPGLQLSGGTLGLGPSFQQGGAITNLTLSGTSFWLGPYHVAGTLNLANGFINVPITVDSGGVLNGTGYTSVQQPITNQGTLNLTSAIWSIDNDGSSGLIAGGIVNNGLMNLFGNYRDLIEGGLGGFEYLLNQGTINQSAGAGPSTLAFPRFLNAGNVTVSSGALYLGFSGELSGAYQVAAGAIVAFSSGSITSGPPVSLSGAGNYYFSGGTLTLTDTTIPGLQLTGGTLALGRGFQQGGAITNLTLAGMNVSPGTYHVAGSMQVYGGEIAGTMFVDSGGVLTQSGGYLVGGGSETVNVGGVLNVTDQIFAFSPITNQGTINLTNLEWVIVNNGNPLSLGGGIVNRGVMNLYGNYGNLLYTPGTGQEYVINEGLIRRPAGVGDTSIGLSLLDNAGTIDVQGGRLYIAHAILERSSRLNLGLNGRASCGQLVFGTATTLNGTLSANLNNSFVPARGNAFAVLPSGSFSGTFAQTLLPPGFQWRTSYVRSAVALEVLAVGLPQFTTFRQVGDALVLSGTNGAPGHPYLVLASTNAALPLAGWEPLASNAFDVTGAFSYTNAVDPSRPAQFFSLTVP